MKDKNKTDKRIEKLAKEIVSGKVGRRELVDLLTPIIRTIEAGSTPVEGRPHMVKVEGRTLLSIRPKRANQYVNSKNAGNNVLLFEKEKLYGLARHSNSRGYDIVAYA